MDTSDELLEELDRERQRLAAEATDLAGRLTAARQEAAGRFAEEVTVELGGLAMPHARIEVAVVPREIGPDGADEVELRLRAHPVPRRCPCSAAPRVASCPA
ncbi:hypothetical protein Psuf_064830 [Phytohabitans suffuscus]|uniref:DNA repair protein RecN n=1 Tax=Phytohabitans suffuscus TaxID=624315 RepID=A0A6F8YSN9_9ACTN|nr:hypothetical protein Psuf_064830 [Phytohabitans suffuscus]